MYKNMYVTRQHSYAITTLCRAICKSTIYSHTYMYIQYNIRTLTTTLCVYTLERKHMN